MVNGVSQYDRDVVKKKIGCWGLLFLIKDYKYMYKKGICVNVFVSFI